MGNETRIWILAAVCALAVGLAPVAASAEESTTEAGGIGAAAAFGSLLYAPAKVAYAIGGGLVGGLAWVFSAGDTEVAGPIWDRSVRGDYVLTPEHVRGEVPIQFIGQDAVPAVAAPPPDPQYPPPAGDPAW